MKKEYKKPVMEVLEQTAEPLMLDTSITQGEGNGDDLPVCTKGAGFDDEDDPADDWNGWN